MRDYSKRVDSLDIGDCYLGNSMRKIVGALLIIIQTVYLYGEYKHSPYDLTIIGQVSWRGSLERLPISLVKLLKNDFSINVIPTPGRFDLRDVEDKEARIISNTDKTPGNVAILFDTLWETKRVPADFVPKESLIKIAYSMIESTAIPPQWVDILNTTFDLVVIPDEYYKSVYQSCGVTIPIFVLPHGADLDDFLNEPAKTPSYPFVFGTSGVFLPRKNHLLLIDAFHAEFGNDPAVKLKIHGRGLFEFDFKQAQKKINTFTASDGKEDKT